MYRLPFPRMPSGKRARQQRQAAATAVRTPPPVRSKGVGRARGRQASPRALAIAGGVVVIAAIAIVLGVVLSGGGGGCQVVKPSDINGLPPIGSQNWPGALQGAGEANDLFKGIPQHGQVLGNPKAHVKMQIFIDVQCPICKQYEITDLGTVVNKYVRPGKVQMELKPWAFIGAQSASGRLGVIAAAEQGKGYEYAKVLYDNQPDNSENSGWLTGSVMARIAASVTGLNLAKWQTDVNSAAAQSTASAVDKLAAQEQVGGTPTILVGPPGGPLHNVETAQELAEEPCSEPAGHRAGARQRARRDLAPLPPKVRKERAFFA